MIRFIALLIIALALSPIAVFVWLTIANNLIWLGYIPLWMFILEWLYEKIKNLDLPDDVASNGNETISSKEKVAAVLTSQSGRRRVIKR